MRLHAATLLFSATICLATEAPKPWRIAFEPVTPERIARLPAREREAWQHYWDTSVEWSKRASGRGLEDFSPDKPLKAALRGAAHAKGLRLDAPENWYASEEARLIADRVVNWQTPAGGWTKSSNYTRERQATDEKREVWAAGTFDNDATISELRFLAHVIKAAGDAKDRSRAVAWRQSFLRGLDYAAIAQYPNGGFPQIYPLAGGYHDAITFNDDAMVHVLELCRDIAERAPLFAFVPAEAVQRAQQTLDRGVSCVLATQLKDANGRPTVWCQQHDAITLQPCAARNFEPAAECSGESAGLVQFLMSLPHRTPEMTAAIEGAITWFRTHALRDVEWDRDATQGTGLVTRPGGPELWARYYELGTGRPIFGDRDRTIHYLVTELSPERRHGYQWFDSRPAAVLKAYDRARRMK
jgi:PelA/Pel-15E family pectate lyase